MVGQMTYGKRQFEGLDGAMRGLIPPFHQAVQDLLLLVDADSSAFTSYMVGRPFGTEAHIHLDHIHHDKCHIYPDHITSTLSNITSTLNSTTSNLSNITSTLSNITSTLSNITSILSNITSNLTYITSTLTNITSILSHITSILSNITSILSNITSTLTVLHPPCDISSTNFKLCARCVSGAQTSASRLTDRMKSDGQVRSGDVLLTVDRDLMFPPSRFRLR